ncbi:hypothetical protein [Aeoliella mucimassa]|uniref:Uncharacterized protein n=1 Tax=Aeoliella mucimassa TaxID=2527972 RepID=A0A518AIC7_9BACT|nr:hypothetical protein [Aeoliella mucimassa]QDU54477.1 hypothetical protein Pan181_06590 [Aeoliella mucimassa]
MGFLKSFFDDVFADERPAAVSVPPTSSFEQISERDLEAHLQVDRYGDFLLTGAVRPSFNLEVVPTAGYRHDVYRDEENRTDVPVLMAAASREYLMDIFMELIEQLGPTVDVVLETSHGHRAGHHTDLYREHIDMPILQSTLWDFEDLLLNDGCTGIAVLNPKVPQEIQLDEHKLLIAYGANLSSYEEILDEHQLPCREEIRFITEAEHVHSSNESYVREFEELKMRLGMDGE